MMEEQANYMSLTPGKAVKQLPVKKFQEITKEMAEEVWHNPEKFYAVTDRLGKLVAILNRKFALNLGVNLSDEDRLNYVRTSAYNIDAARMKKLTDSKVSKGIRRRAFIEETVQMFPDAWRDDFFKHMNRVCERGVFKLEVVCRAVRDECEGFFQLNRDSISYIMEETKWVYKKNSLDPQARHFVLIKSIKDHLSVLKHERSGSVDEWKAQGDKLLSEARRKAEKLSD